MSRGPLKAPDNVLEDEMGPECPRCHRPRDEHRLLTVHVCYSDTVIKHRLCPAAFEPEPERGSGSRSTDAPRS